MSWTLSSPFMDLLRQWKGCPLLRSRRKLWHVIPDVVACSIWLETYRRLFQDREMVFEGLLGFYFRNVAFGLKIVKSLLI